jgi:hypothetical protein
MGYPQTSSTSSAQESSQLIAINAQIQQAKGELAVAQSAISNHGLDAGQKSALQTRADSLSAAINKLETQKANLK